MRVLYIHRKGLFDQEGGEQDQIRNTKAALERLGVNIVLADSLPCDLASFDLIHFFGIHACHIDNILAAKGIPKALSTVFWDYAQGYPLDVEYEEWPRPGRELYDRARYWAWRASGLHARRVANIARIRFHVEMQRHAGFQAAINEIDLFLPNSKAEIDSVSRSYVIDNCRYKIIPNAVDVSAVDNPSDYAERHLPRQTPFVCCSGGIDRRKNQYFLMKAMLEIDVPVVFAGGVRDRRYCEMVQRVAMRANDVYFLGHLPQPDLHSVYRAAAVHALPSIYDTPGITNLEAVAHACANVGTQIGGLREYLGEHSLYCNPFSVEHIRDSVARALQLPPNKEGAGVVRSKYTYECAAATTLDAYQSVLAETG